MSAQQRSSRDISLLDLDRVQVQQHLSEQLPEPTSSPASPEGRQAGKNDNVARESSVPDHSVHRFVPLSRQDEIAANLPELNFRPLALALKYLVPLMIWQLLCLSGVITLTVLSRVKPPWLHLESEYSYNAWFYSPGVIGFLTTVLWRGTLQSYNRILPYVRMANVPLDISGGGAPGSTGQHLLNGIPSGEIHMGVLFSLWRSGDYMSLVVNITPIPIIFLTPIKSGILGLVMDESGWGIRISFSFCIMAAVIYVWLFAATLAIALHLRTRRTGLKWNPCTLAAQVSLVQGSNMLEKFADIPTEQWAPLFNTVRDWPEKGLVLRLGYWREQGTDIIVHGVRFLPRTLYHDAGDEEAQSSIWTDRDDSSPSQNPAGAVQRQDVSKPDVNRFWNSNLQDGYLILVSIIGAGVITVATVAWAKGYIGRPLDISFLQAPSLGDAGSHFFSDILANFVRGILFALLPTLAFGIFHNNFLAVDIYRRNMAPVYNMASPLPEDEQERLIPGTSRQEDATARNSMLLDFITPDFTTCLVLAGGAGEYRLVLGLVLATFCNLVYIIVGSLFSFELSSVPSSGEGSGRGQRYSYTATIHRRQFIACYVILIVYCISIWLLRPRGVARTCRRLLTLLDFVSLIHKSHILQCPEFWVQNHWSDTEEHLKSQVTLANRIYRFGVYVGTDDHQYVGISVQKVPETWVESPDYPSTRKSLLLSAELAKDVLRGGLYGESASSAEGLLASRHDQAETVDDRVYSNTHPKLWQGMEDTKVRRRRRRQEDVESGIQMQEVRRDQGDTSGAGVAGYAPGLRQTPLADEDEDEQR